MDDESPELVKDTHARHLCVAPSYEYDVGCDEDDGPTTDAPVPRHEAILADYAFKPG